ncbi:GntR family transcriptional regulator [Anaerococcus sp. AGMB00486]|uniref:GntR family transcriptional regulator n=2 Tax=Anaerococcus TaxID=165779 RepID=A0ABX2NC20_9FIRM|nr:MULTISPECIES: GntR family transcriptional regulator [Anaerococcus]MDY3006863.1 GntR family transcriptional regulator [Anaerococcus porci]MSS77810.1 GntR family transcriptional regulator [Anaerococcus porci]NVF12244.1 GntR family transcriptional regulator [Anaerococcus faecalis]
MNFKILERKDREKTKDYVIRNMRYNILFFNLVPGEKISENQISDLLNLSRTPVREAFIDLNSSLLLDIKPQIGTFISFLNIDMSKELLFFRSSLEQNAVIEICKKGNLTLEKEFNEIIEKEQMLHQTNDFEKLIKLDNRFHELIFEELNYKKIPKIIENNTSYLIRMRILRLKANIRQTNYIDEHKNILELIKNNSPKEASRLITSHILELIDDMKILNNKYPDYFN